MQIGGIVENKNLRLECMAIGSLPHKNVDEAMELVEKNFSALPFWPQLAKFDKNEDMIVQFLENMAGITFNDDKIYLDGESDEFFEQLEQLFLDFEEKKGYEINYSSTFSKFIELVKKHKPKYAKGQIVGPFTLATSLVDKEGKCAFYDETLKEVIVKTLALKALWQIEEIKKASPETTPIIFIDEPSISQLGTSAFITITKEEVVEMIKEISDLIKESGGLSAIHCCGKCDWAIPVECGVDIINLDGFFFAQSLSLFHKQIKPFLENGGIIAWGIIPTLDSEALSNSTIDTMIDKFDKAIHYLVKKGIDKDLILNNSMVTPSCGAGSLSVELAYKAMDLTKELSQKLKDRY